jgi:hypothetical protein
MVIMGFLVASAQSKQKSSFQNSSWTLNLTDWVTFPAIFVATQRYIPLFEMRVLVIFIEPEGRNVCLKVKTDIRPQNMRIQTPKATAFP